MGNKIGTTHVLGMALIVSVSVLSFFATGYYAKDFQLQKTQERLGVFQAALFSTRQSLNTARSSCLSSSLKTYVHSTEYTFVNKARYENPVVNINKVNTCLVEKGKPIKDSSQDLVLRLAYQQGEKVGYPETIQALALQETLAGILGPVGDINLPVGKRSYGVMQLKVVAAHQVFNIFPEVFPIKPKTEEELILRLITDQEFNLKIGSYYFKWLHAYFQKKGTKFPWKRAVLAYNRGFLKGDPNNYVAKIKKYIVKRVRPFNRKLVVVS